MDNVIRLLLFVVVAVTEWSTFLPWAVVLQLLVVRLMFAIGVSFKLVDLFISPADDLLTKQCFFYTGKDSVGSFMYLRTQCLKLFSEKETLHAILAVRPEDRD